jgi:hypothetical protein
VTYAAGDPIFSATVRRRVYTAMRNRQLIVQGNPPEDARGIRPPGTDDPSDPVEDGIHIGATDRWGSYSIPHNSWVLAFYPEVGKIAALGESAGMSEWSDPTQGIAAGDAPDGSDWTPILTRERLDVLAGFGTASATRKHPRTLTTGDEYGGINSVADSEGNRAAVGQRAWFGFSSSADILYRCTDAGAAVPDGFGSWTGTAPAAWVEEEDQSQRADIVSTSDGTIRDYLDADSGAVQTRRAMYGGDYIGVWVVNDTLAALGVLSRLFYGGPWGGALFYPSTMPPDDLGAVATPSNQYGWAAGYSVADSRTTAAPPHNWSGAKTAAAAAFVTSGDSANQFPYVGQYTNGTRGRNWIYNAATAAYELVDDWTATAIASEAEIVYVEPCRVAAVAHVFAYAILPPFENPYGASYYTPAAVATFDANGSGLALNQWTNIGNHNLAAAGGPPANELGQQIGDQTLTRHTGQTFGNKAAVPVWTVEPPAPVHPTDQSDAAKDYTGSARGWAIYGGADGGPGASVSMGFAGYVDYSFSD